MYNWVVSELDIEDFIIEERRSNGNVLLAAKN